MAKKKKKAATSKRRRQAPTKRRVNVEKLRDSDPQMKGLFWEVVRGDKDVADLNANEIRALIVRVGYLSDEERARFAPVLVRENLTDFDVDRYNKLQALDRYFPIGKVH